jgi:hypothetical protein
VTGTRPAHDPGDAIVAALLQITEQAERLAVLDEREAGHYRQVAERLAELAGQVAETSSRADDIRAAVSRQAAILGSLDGLDEQVAGLASRLTGIIPDRDGEHDGGDHGGEDEARPPYLPARAAPWWKLSGEEREQAIARLRAWVEQVYRPGYGHLAAALGRCWEQHPLCLYGLDWLMELWSVLYLTPTRNAPVLASQAELQTRLLPGFAEQMYLETTRCEHAQQAPGRRQPSSVAADSGNGARRPRPPASS